MKKVIIYFAAVALMCGCGKEKEKPGSIYGVITDKETGEPMRASGVELYSGKTLITKTVTGDEGQYEFVEINGGEYRLVVTVNGYKNVDYQVAVSAGKIARADMQLERLNTGLTVNTVAVTDIVGNTVTFSGGISWGSGMASSTPSPTEYGFVYATHTNPSNGGRIVAAQSIIDNSVGTWTGTFHLLAISSTVNDLAKGTYYVRAYAKNSIGHEYGMMHSFQISE